MKKNCVWLYWPSLRELTNCYTTVSSHSHRRTCEIICFLKVSVKEKYNTYTLSTNFNILVEDYYSIINVPNILQVLLLLVLINNTLLYITCIVLKLIHNSLYLLYFLMALFVVLLF